VHLQQFKTSFGIEWLPPCHHLINNRAQCKNVRCGSDWPATQLLRRHIGNSPRRKIQGRAGSHYRTFNFSNAKIDDLYLLLALAEVLQHDVVRLQITMKDATIMGRRQCSTYLLRHFGDSFEVHAFSRHHRAKGYTFDILHDDEGPAIW
jgi:hypothetical protein